MKWISGDGRYEGTKVSIVAVCNISPTIKKKSILPKPTDPDVITLADNISKNKLRKPIFVYRSNAEHCLYKIIDGHHRWAALKFLKRKLCKVVIMTVIPPWRRK